MNIIFLIKPKCDTAYLYTDDSVRQGLEKMYYQTCSWELLPEKMSSDTLQKYDFL